MGAGVKILKLNANGDTTTANFTSDKWSEGVYARWDGGKEDSASGVECESVERKKDVTKKYSMPWLLSRPLAGQNTHLKINQASPHLAVGFDDPSL